MSAVRTADGAARGSRPPGPVEILDNPIRERNPRLGRAFEAVVMDLLREEPRKPMRVRFGALEEDGAPCFLCKVEYAGAAGPGRERSPWRWWSPLLRSPGELREALRHALAARRRRRGTAAADGIA